MKPKDACNCDICDWKYIIRNLYCVYIGDENVNEIEGILKLLKMKDRKEKYTKETEEVDRMMSHVGIWVFMKRNRRNCSRK